MNKLAILVASGTLALSAGLASAQDSQSGEAGQMMDHGSIGMMDMSHMPEHMQGMMGAMQTMMQNMPTESSNNADADFLLMMIPHHQSAIDMARVELEQGQDEETRTMAQEMINSQQKEIDEMRAMLDRMGVEAPAAPAQ